MNDGMYEARPAYSVLRERMGDAMTDVRYSQNVNLIIDVKQLFRKAFRKGCGYDDVGTFDSAMAVEAISSEMLNVAGHYRNFLFKEYGKYTTIYFLYSTGKCEAIQRVIPSYKESFYKKYIDGIDGDSIRPNIVSRVAKAVRLVAAKVPHCYFIDTTEFDEHAVARWICAKSLPSDACVILSNDEAFLCQVRGKVMVLSAKGPDSELIREGGAMARFLGRENKNISDAMLLTLISLSGDERCSVKGIPGIGPATAAKIVGGLIASGRLVDAEHLDFPLKRDMLDPSKATEKAVADGLASAAASYEVLGGSHMMLRNEGRIADLVASSARGGGVDGTLYMNIDSKAFPDYPVNFEMLTKGERR
jgi:hypothetical protein